MQVGNSLPQQTPAALGPILIPALHLSRAELGLLTSAIWGGMLLGMLPAGLLVDRHGERLVIGIGGVLLAGFMFLATLAGSFTPLFLLFLPAALAAASGSPGGASAVASWFDDRRRGLALGIRQTGVTGAGVVAALALPPIALNWGWRAAFQAVAVAVLISTLAFVLFFPEPPRRHLATAAFRVRSLLRDRTFLMATAFAWMFMGAFGAAVTYLAAALHQDQHVTIGVAASLLAVMQVGGLLGRIGWGALSDRLASRGRVMAICSGLAMVAGSGMAMASFRPLPLLVLAPLAFLLGLSTMGWNALYITLASEVNPRRAATVVGAGSTVTFTGLFAVTPCFGLIADATHTYLVAWIAFVVWAGVATIVALAIADRTNGGKALHSSPPTERRSLTETRR